MDIDGYDDDERPTLPSPVPLFHAFDTETELFLSNTPTLPELAIADDVVAMWWAEQRRRALVGWVTATMALCVAMLAAALLVA
jgi:hypothetical protein